MQNLSPFQGWRLTLFQAVIFAVFIIFSLRMYQMQILDSADAQIAADDNRLNELPIPADRGVIFDRYNQILASNVPAYVVRVIPAALPANREEELAIFNELSALTGVPPTRVLADARGEGVRSIEELVAEGEGIAPFRPVPIAQDVPLEVALQIREESYRLPGVDVQVAAVRQYPTGELTSHIIGYMGPIRPEEQLELIERGYDPAFDRIGYAGIESYMETELAGQRGSILREIDVAGEEIEELERIDPVAGQNLRLTIDVELQRAAQTALNEQINQINSFVADCIAARADGPEAGGCFEIDANDSTDAGVVIAMDPNTGEILAMVSYPSYDNARFARAIDVDYYLSIIENPRNPLLNQAISSLYPPGSTWKLLTSTAVLEEDIINPNQTLFDPGDIIVQNRYAPNDPAASQRFVCWNREGHGNVNLRRAIAESCNVYFYQVGGGNENLSEAMLRQGGLGINQLFRYGTAFGVGSLLGVELIGEVAGRMPDPTWKRLTEGESWSTGDTYNAAVGQGYVLTTPLQLITAVAAIVNDGTVYRPTLIREFLDAERNITQPFQPEIIRTLNTERPAADGTLVLHMVEDMIIQGEDSIACRCEPSAGESYNPARCDPGNYRAQLDIAPDFATNMREYTVNIPEDYIWSFSRFCDPRRFDSDFIPAFAASNTLDFIRQGMRDVIEYGTANPEYSGRPTDITAMLEGVPSAGKTGTAEYCDNIAGALGRCEPGNWPSHAWYVGYMPYENPEVLVVAFVYNGDEGSANAVPVVAKVLDAYQELQRERGSTSSAVAVNP
jgi:penicillin-binding protein 2